MFVKTDVTELESAARLYVESILGRKLADSDPLLLFLKSLLNIIIQQRALINDSAEQNLLRFARGGNLEALGELVGVNRHNPTRAFCTVEVQISAIRQKETVIPAGTRFSAGDGVKFQLAEDVIFLAGETVKTCRAECMEVGAVGNNYAPAELSKIVDYSPFLKSITNITTSEGGADVETDDDLRERIRNAPESFSVAGSKGAYEFWTKDFNSEIIDAHCISPEPGLVDVYFLMENGVPGTEMINAVQNYLSDEKIRPLTDLVTVKPPEIFSYNIDVKYYISRRDQTSALDIINKAETAVQQFIKWQKSKLGRDLNPTELYFKLRGVNVKRAEIFQPQFNIVAENAVAICEEVNLIYGGLEDE